MKLLLLLVYSIAIFFVQSWWVMAVFVAIVVVCAIVGRLPASRMVAPLVPVIFLALFAVVFAFWSSPTVEGLFGGLLVAVRMVALVAASFIVCFTTTSTNLLRALSWFIGPLRFLHIPVDDIAFTLSLAIRFIPVVAEELRLVRMAQQARGGDLDNLGFTDKLRIWGVAFTAVFVGLFRHADALASAMDSRCYGASDRRTSLH